MSGIGKTTRYTYAEIKQQIPKQANSTFAQLNTRQRPQERSQTKEPHTPTGGGYFYKIFRRNILTHIEKQCQK
jgi:hypothetical protein